MNANKMLTLIAAVVFAASAAALAEVDKLHNKYYGQYTGAYGDCGDGCPSYFAIFNGAGAKVSETFQGSDVDSARIHWNVTPGTGYSLKCSCDGVTFDNVVLSEVTVHPKLVQFVPDSSKFPKCINEQIGRSDFAIVTDPAGSEDQVTITGLSTTTAGDKTATGTLGPITKSAVYTVNADGVEHWEQAMPANFRATFTNGTVVVYDRIHLGVPGGIIYKEFKRNGTVVGTGGEPVQEGPQSPWSVCGNGLTRTDTEGFEKGGSIGVTWSAVKDILSFEGGVSFSYSTSTSFSYEAAGRPRRKTAIKQWQRPISVVTSGNNLGFREVFYDNAQYWEYAPYQATTGSFTDPTDSGWAAPTNTLGTQCCTP